jgi:hypothetical protein
MRIWCVALASSIQIPHEVPLWELTAPHGGPVLGITIDVVRGRREMPLRF